MRHVLHTMHARMKGAKSISLICFLFVAPVPWRLRYKLFLKPFPTLCCFLLTVAHKSFHLPLNHCTYAKVLNFKHGFNLNLFTSLLSLTHLLEFEITHWFHCLLGIRPCEVKLLCLSFLTCERGIITVPISQGFPK